MLATYVVAVVVAVLVDDLVGVDDVLARALVGDLVATGVVFLASVLANNSSMYDPYWSVAPIALAAFWARAPAGGAADPARVVLVVTLVCVWGGRLTLNFLRRWRGLGDEDFRYRDLRARSGRAYWLVSLTGIHLFPTALVFAGMLPVWAVLTGPGGALGPLDVVAAVVTASAIAVEAVADAQLRRFLRGGPPAGAICATGLWRLSRHPNYFGEVLFWWGLWLFALAASPALAWTAVGALAITALFLGVSLPMMERRSRSRRPAYADHAARTALLVPWPRPRRRL
ncbi:MAG: DUF1295 domain-containing protein [Myxococcales bacterium]|nr:DUF1295 domain-containing protein [Myxococcales bacterium]MCB9737480.1 DUF1295 domain-containing protein [Deltaproteobacteria bacterium]